jgi:hypothetical protein
MPFVRFTESGRSYKPRVSLRQNGTIGFNNGAVRKWKLDTFSFVVLFYDQDRKSIGIKPTNTEEEGAHKLNFGKAKKSAWVSCRKFFDFFDIPVQDTKRFDGQIDEKEKMILVQMP